MRIVTRLLLGLLILGVLVFGAAALFLTTFDPDDYKDTLIARVKAATGRDLTLEGPLEFAFWPQLRLHLGPLSLSNAPGFGEEPMVVLEETQIAVATLPLLRGRIEMDTLKLTGAVLNLARDAEGRTNWDDLDRQDDERSRDDGERLGVLLLGGVDIVNAKLTWRDHLQGRDVVISELNAQSGPLAFGDPVPLTLNARVASTKPALTGDLTLTSTTTYDLKGKRYGVDPLEFTAVLRGKTLPGGKAEIAGRAVLALDLATGEATIRDLTISGLGHRATGEISLDHLNAEHIGARGHFEFAGKDLGVLFRAFALPAAPQVAAMRDRSLSFKTIFEKDVITGSLAVPTFEASVLGATLNGELHGERTNTDTPALSGKLSARGANLPALILLSNQIMNAGAQSAPGLAKALAAVKERAFTLDTEFTADLAAGQLELPLLRAELLGNDINGAITSQQGSTGEPVLTGQITAIGPDLTALALTIGALRGIDSDGLSALNTVLGKRQDRAFSFKTTLNADPGLDWIAFPAVTAALFGNELTGSFSATAPTSDQPAFDGEIAAQGPDFPALLALVGSLRGDGSALPGLAESLAAVQDKAFTFGTRFALDTTQGRISLPSLALRALGLTLVGSLNATAFNHPSGGVIDGRVTLQGTELAPMLAALGQAELAESVRTLKFEAGLKGNAHTLAVSPFAADLEVIGPSGAPVLLKLAVGTAEANLQRETLSLKQIALTGLGLDVKGGLDATQINSALKYTGQLEVPIFDLRSVLATLNKPINLTDPSALTRVGLDARVQGSADGYALDALTLKLDDTTLEGNLAVKNQPEKAVTFDLEVDRLNADRYLAPEDDTRAKPVTPEAAAAATAQLPAETLRKVAVDGNIAVGDLRFAGAKLTNVAVALQGRQGRLGINPVSADLYGGRYTGVITLDAAGDVPQLAFDTTLAKVAIEPLLLDMTGNSALAGTVNFEARLTALGGDSEQMIRSLNGPASFAITGGLFRGVDVPAVLTAAELIIESKSLQPVPTGGVTQFQSLTGSLDIENGIVTNEDLLLDGEGFKVAGDGMLANLNDMTIKYDARIAVEQGGLEQGATRYNLGDYVIPIRCRGTISGTSCLPDLGALVTRAAGEAVKDAIEKELNDSLDGAGKALKNLLKF